MSRIPLECHLVMRTIRYSIPLESIELPGEFFPAHLSVALLDAIFPSPEGHDDQGTRAAIRYSRRFEIAYARTDRWELPPAEEQETLSDLIGRHTELGEDRMGEMLFPIDERFPGTKLAGTSHFLRTAIELEQIGIRVLQDIRALGSEKIEHCLRLSAGLRESAIRRFLMYTGDDDFVRGDAHVRTFVAEATGRSAVSAAQAEDLVRRAAYEFILSPRYLDFAIWTLRGT